MSTNQNTLNKGNQKGGAQDQRRNENETREAKHGEQSRNDKKHLQQGQRQPRIEFGTSKFPKGDPASK
jgi:hypothetical protein